MSAQNEQITGSHREAHIVRRGDLHPDEETATVADARSQGQVMGSFRFFRIEKHFALWRYS